MAGASANPAVLIVDDMRAMRAIVRSLLVAMKIHDIRETGDGEEALAALARRSVDFIITDLNMAPMNGVEFTQRVRQLRNGNSKVPVLMISAHTEHANVAAAVKAGVTYFLSKPLVPADFSRRVKAALFPHQDARRSKLNQYVAL